MGREMLLDNYRHGGINDTGVSDGKFDTPAVVVDCPKYKPPQLLWMCCHCRQRVVVEIDGNRYDACELRKGSNLPMLQEVLL